MRRVPARFERCRGLAPRVAVLALARPEAGASGATCRDRARAGAAQPLTSTMKSDATLAWPVASVATALSYALAAAASLLLTGASGYGSPLYPSAGIALVSVLLFGWRMLPAVWAGLFIAQLLLKGSAPITEPQRRALARHRPRRGAAGGRRGRGWCGASRACR